MNKMPGIKEKKIKEYLRLICEYAKRNKAYRKYCHDKRRGDKQPEFHSPRNLHSIKLRSLYNLIGDIFLKKFNFEEWWESNKEIFLFPNPVRDFKEVIGTKIDKIIARLEETKKRTKRRRKPSAEELREYLVDHLNSTPERAIIEIDLSGEESPKALGKQVRELLEPMMYNSRVRQQKRNKAFMRMSPPRPFRSTALLHNLRVYDLHKKDLSWRGIASELYPKEDYDERIRRKLDIQLENARTDIDNVVKGQFPSHQKKPRSRFSS